jgi:hypothetical protein
MIVRFHTGDHIYSGHQSFLLLSRILYIPTEIYLYRFQQVMPLMPINKPISIVVGNSRKTVTRNQLPLAPAYVFTDYQSPGQTLPSVIVDIAMPPFNAYV